MLTQITKKTRPFEIQPIDATTLPDVANSLFTWQSNVGKSSLQLIQKRLQWLLIENPLAAEACDYGFCIRDASGVIRGMTISFPAAFLAADVRLLALCSGSFFVEPQARVGGFYLFKRYLAARKFSFFFATSCNARSAALWQAVGGAAVPGSGMEYLLPLKLDVMLPAALGERTARGVVTRAARSVGRCVNPFLRYIAPKSRTFRVELCRDWQRLSDLFNRHRSPDSVTRERSARFLEWRYGPNSPNHDSKIYVFHDKRGNEGWFSLGNVVRGRQQQIQGRILMDAIWPKGKISFSDILPPILDCVAFNADAIFFPARQCIDYGSCGRWIFPRKLEAPQIWAVAPKVGLNLDISSMDIVAADGDNTWSKGELNPDRTKPRQRI